MAYDIYTTTQLMGAYGVIDKPNPFILNTFFRSQIMFDTQYVAFDKVNRQRRLAPLVIPSAQGKAQKLQAYQTTTIQPAYIKVKHSINPAEMLARRAGELIGGSETAQERFQFHVANQLQNHENQITRREEYMAIQCMLTGGVTLADTDYPSTTISYNRPSGNTIQLTTGTTWGTSGVDPLANLQSWSTQVQQISGYAPRVVVMDPLAFELFSRAPGVAIVMNTFRQQTGDVNLAGYPVGAVGNEVQLMANVSGFEIWVYQGYYNDDNGNSYPLMPANTVLMGDPVGCGGTRLYGAIQDFGSLVPAARYPKMWVENDPSAYQLMTQSAPLPALGWAEATLAATVA